MTHISGAETVILVVCDSLRADTVSEMDTLAELATNGVTYTDSHAPGAGTPSSMPGIMQSRLPIEHGGYGLQLPPGTPTLAETVAETGTATLGLHSNGYTTAEAGFDRGFDDFADLFTGSLGERGDDTDTQGGSKSSSGHDVRTALKSTGLYKPAQALYDQLDRLGIIENRAYASATELIDATIEWLSGEIGVAGESSQRFVWLQVMDTHSPFEPPREHREQVPGADIPPWQIHDLNHRLANEVESVTQSELDTLRALYRAETKYTDDEIARLVDYLKSTGKWESTALIVTGDHGELFGGPEVPTEDYSARHPNYLCEELTHVPLVLVGGAVEGTGEEKDTLVSGVDLAPTIADALNAEIPTEWDGCILGTEAVEDRETVTSALAHTRRGGVEIEQDALHVAVRSDDYAVLWWHRDIAAEVFERTATGEEYLGTPSEVDIPEVNDLLESARSYADIDLCVVEDGDVGGEVSERLRELGYVE